MEDEKKREIPEVAPNVVEHLVEEADKAGVAPVVAKWMIKDAVADGIAPDKVADVVKEAIKPDSEDDKLRPPEKGRSRNRRPQLASECHLKANHQTAWVRVSIDVLC